MRRFVARRREEKDEVPDRAEGHVRRIHRGGISIRRDGSGAWTRTRILGSKGPCATNCTTPDRSRKSVAEIRVLVSGFRFAGGSQVVGARVAPAFRRAFVPAPRMPA